MFLARLSCFSQMNIQSFGGTAGTTFVSLANAPEKVLCGLPRRTGRIIEVRTATRQK